jgi:hypothetical protein
MGMCCHVCQCTNLRRLYRNRMNLVVRTARCERALVFYGVCRQDPGPAVDCCLSAVCCCCSIAQLHRDYAQLHRDTDRGARAMNVVRSHADVHTNRAPAAGRSQLCAIARRASHGSPPRRHGPLRRCGGGGAGRKGRVASSRTDVRTIPLRTQLDEALEEIQREKEEKHKKPEKAQEEQPKEEKGERRRSASLLTRGSDTRARPCASLTRAHWGVCAAAQRVRRRRRRTTKKSRATEAPSPRAPSARTRTPRRTNVKTTAAAEAAATRPTESGTAATRATAATAGQPVRRLSFRADASCCTV